MTREQVSNIIEGISEEQISKLLNINSADIGKAKGDFEKMKSQLTEAQSTISELEKNKTDVEKMQEEINKYKQAEADRLEAEKQAKVEEELNKRFTAVIGEAKFVNELTKNGIFNEFKSALSDETNKGKGDSEIYTTLTKDREDIFANPNKTNINMGGAGNIDPDKVGNDTIRKIMGLPVNKD